MKAINSGEPTESSLPHFEAEKGDIGPENTYLVNIND
jgi:hypothetical protein